jgi:hypothetical protein
MGAISGNIAKSPDSLLTNIGLGASKKLDEDRDGTSFDDYLGLGGGARCNVGQGPCSLELYQSMG